MANPLTSPTLLSLPTVGYADYAISVGGKFLYLYLDNDGDGTCSGSIVDCTGEAPQAGTPVQFYSGEFVVYITGVAVSDTQALVLFTTDNNQVHYSIATVSGHNVSFGSSTYFLYQRMTSPSVAYDKSNDKLLFTYATNSDDHHVRVGTFSNGSPSFGSALDITDTAGEVVWKTKVTFDDTTGKFVVFYQYSDTKTGYSVYECRAKVLSVSGTTVTPGAYTSFENASEMWATGDVCSVGGKFIFIYYVTGTASIAKVVSISGNSLVLGGSTVLYLPTGITEVDVSDCYHDAGSDLVFIAYSAQGTNKLFIATGSVTDNTFDIENTYLPDTQTGWSVWLSAADDCAGMIYMDTADYSRHFVLLDTQPSEFWTLFSGQTETIT